MDLQTIGLISLTVASLMHSLTWWLHQRQHERERTRARLSLPPNALTNAPSPSARATVAEIRRHMISLQKMADAYRSTVEPGPPGLPPTTAGHGETL